MSDGHYILSVGMLKDLLAEPSVQTFDRAYSKLSSRKTKSTLLQIISGGKYAFSEPSWCVDPHFCETHVGKGRGNPN